jgi:hypothetical protein
LYSFGVQVLSAYIHCIRDEEHLLHREGEKVFLENTFISSLLKRDGDPKMLLNCKEDTIEKRVDNYLQSDMVDLKLSSFLIYVMCNILLHNTYKLMLMCMIYEDVHSNKYRKFSLVPGSSECKKSEVHVLDSMGQHITDRRYLYTTLSNYLFYIMIISSLHYLLSINLDMFYIYT